MKLNIIRTENSLYLIDINNKIDTDMWSKYPIGTAFLRNLEDCSVGFLCKKELGYDPSGYPILGYLSLSKDNSPLDVPILPQPKNIHRAILSITNALVKQIIDLSDDGYTPDQIYNKLTTPLYPTHFKLNDEEVLFKYKIEFGHYIYGNTKNNV